MSWHISRGRISGLFLVGAVLAALALPTVVLADTGVGTPTIQSAQQRGATITIGSVRTISKVVALVHVSVVCDPFEVYDWQTGQTIQTTAGAIEEFGVVILQPQGKRIAWGQGYGSGLATCDGATVNGFDVAVTAQALPFATKAAVAGATVFVADRATYQGGDYASSGPVEIRLGR